MIINYIYIYIYIYAVNIYLINIIYLKEFGNLKVNMKVNIMI